LLCLWDRHPPSDKAQARLKQRQTSFEKAEAGAGVEASRSRGERVVQEGTTQSIEVEIEEEEEAMKIVEHNRNPPRAAAEEAG